MEDEDSDDDEADDDEADDDCAEDVDSAEVEEDAEDAEDDVAEDSDGALFGAAEPLLVPVVSLAGAGAKAGVGAEEDEDGGVDPLVVTGADVVGLLVVDVTGGGVLDDGASRGDTGARLVEAVVGATGAGARVCVGVSTVAGTLGTMTGAGASTVSCTEGTTAGAGATGVATSAGV